MAVEYPNTHSLSMKIKQFFTVNISHSIAIFCGAVEVTNN
jgi:hypothetical protein